MARSVVRSGMLLSRRGLITGLASFLAAPAIVRASSLMPVKAVPAPQPYSEEWMLQTIYRDEYIREFERARHDLLLYGTAVVEMPDGEVRSFRHVALNDFTSSPASALSSASSSIQRRSS